MKDLSLGFHTAPYELFFEKEPDYQKIKPCFKMLDLLAEVNNVSICVLDFYKHEYAYISQNHIFLCGYSLDEAKSQGEKIAEKIIHPEDKIEQSKMKDAACIFMCSLDKDRLEKLQLYTTHRLIHKNGTVFMVSNKYKPFMFDDKDRMWLALCVSTLSTKNHPIESYIEIAEYGERFTFSLKRTKFIASKSIKISSKEHDILIFTSQGYTSREIAEKMNVSLNTIKFHKQNIITKLNVRNISEACLYAYTHNLF